MPVNSVACRLGVHGCLGASATYGLGMFGMTTRAMSNGTQIEKKMPSTTLAMFVFLAHVFV